MDQSESWPQILFQTRDESSNTYQDNEALRTMVDQLAISSRKPIFNPYYMTMTWEHSLDSTPGEYDDGIQTLQNEPGPHGALQHEIDSSSGPDLCEQCSVRWVRNGDRLEEVRESIEGGQEGKLLSIRDLFSLEPYLRGRMPRIILEWNLSSMRQNEDSCSLCKLILMTLNLSGVLERTKDANAKVLGVLEEMSHHRYKSTGSLHAVSLTLQATEVQSGPNWHYIFPIGVVPDDGRALWWARDTYSTTTYDNRRKIDINLLERFLQVCKGHTNCRPHRVEVPGLRVIDVLHGRVVPAPPGAHYAALSYVWGGVDQMRLTTDTEGLLTTTGSVTSESRFLSAVIRDALYFCALMEQRYLWVDTLCIMQDDPVDVATQIAYMDNVYLRAAFTIVAAAGADCNAGLPGLRSERAPKPGMVMGQVDGVQMVGIHQSCGKLLESSVWNTRGWTFQEHVCSRKAFIFSDNLAFFVCGEGIMREDCMFSVSSPFGVYDPVIAKFRLQPGTDMWNEGDSPSLFRFGTFFPTERSGTHAWALWTDLLPQYLKRKLTLESDRINAFKGMLRALEPALQGFRSGLPKKFFARSLLWYGLNRRHTRPEDFPTWSWAAWSASQPSDVLAFQTQNDCVQWTPTFTALDPDEKQWSSSPEENFREPERFGQSHAHDNFRGQEHFACSQNSAVFDVDRNFSHEHFTFRDVEEEKMREIASGLDNNQRLENIVFFYTSTVELLVDRPDGPICEREGGLSDTLDVAQSRCAVRASDGTILDYICVDPAWRATQPDKLTFVALFVHEDRYPPVFAIALTKMSEYLKRLKRELYHPGKYSSVDDCYAVVAMLVEWDHSGVARRIGIPEENAFYYRSWLAEKPEYNHGFSSVAQEPSPGCVLCLLQCTAVHPFAEFLRRTRNTTYQDYAFTPVRDEYAFLEIQKHILDMYGGVAFSANFRSYLNNDGYTDCILFCEQPSIYLLDLTDEEKTPPPDDEEADLPDLGSATDGVKGQPIAVSLFRDLQAVDVFGNPQHYLNGTVPQRRLTLERITRYGTLYNFFAKSPFNSTTPGMRQITMTIEAGWIVGGPIDDGKTYPFIYYTTGHYGEGTGCYNEEWAGQYELRLAWKLVNSKWCLYYQRSNPRSNPFRSYLVGWYPVSLFGTAEGRLGKNAKRVTFGGEVADVDAWNTYGEMGSGRKVTGSNFDSYSQAAYQRMIQRKRDKERNAIETWELARITETGDETAERCYNRFINPLISGALPEWGMYMFFGGPGGEYWDSEAYPWCLALDCPPRCTIR
ncbi:hypothetical protein DL771_004743 [Monosporascus sp. 5C6A]|nr:hypothetical protein DL771_004743 [Monosporascus sp. 5C6A]